MANLAACYFCGTAADAEAVRLGGDASATLCPDCRGKLETILEAIEEERSMVESPADDQTVAAEDESEMDTSTARSEPDDADTEDESPQSIVEGEHDVSALEHNKVMRLLENREFPIQRDEFVAVAANAYQVDHTDCDRVIDAAIAEGLIDEEDGKLIRPD